MKNKKLFAILTLVCFMFTLMPVAAFAADQVLVNGEAEADDVEVGTPFTVALQSGAKDYAFYAVDEDNKGVAITTGSSLKIKVAGDYQVFAVPVAYGVDQLVKNANDITHNETPATAVAKIQGAFDDTIVKAYATVTVVDKEAKYAVTLSKNEVTVAADNGFKGNDVVTVTLTNNDKAITGVVPEITAPSYVTVVPVSAKNVTTDANGAIKYNVSANRGGTFEVVFAYEDATEKVLTVYATDDVVANVELVKSATNPINKKPVDDKFNTGAVLKFADINGSVKEVKGTANDAGLIADTAKVTVISQPAGSKLAGKNFALVDSATTGCSDLVVNTTTDLKVGSYEVKVALENGKAVTAKFEAAKMGDVVGIRFVDPATTVALDAVSPAFTVEAYDANGVTRTLNEKEYDLDAQGKALVEKGNDTFTVSDDEKYVGTTITVLAKTDKFIATTVLEVVDKGMEVVYEDTTAEVGVTTVLDAKVVDEKGNKVAVPTCGKGEAGDKYDVKVVVLDKPENAYAYVDAEVVGAKDIDVTFLGSVAGEYKIQTIVVDDNNEYVTGIETITVGANADSFKDIVVMSIGAKKLVANNEVKEIPTAPVVENNRTFVPLRALIEAFGADVVWDGAARTVTVTLDGTVVVMTVGSAEYTVNGEVKTADVAPYINADDFTMVPVRFVAQAFDITVTPVYGDNGATVDVLFAK